MSRQSSRNERVLLDPNDEQLSKITQRLSLLADQARLRILFILARGSVNVTTLCNLLELSQPAVSHHLSRLRVAEFVQGDRHGKERIYSLSGPGRSALEACQRLL